VGFAPSTLPGSLVIVMARGAFLLGGHAQLKALQQRRALHVHRGMVLRAFFFSRHGLLFTFYRIYDRNLIVEAAILRDSEQQNAEVGEHLMKKG
jgi:hypothetical protein